VSLFVRPGRLRIELNLRMIKMYVKLQLDSSFPPRITMHIKLREIKARSLRQETTRRKEKMLICIEPEPLINNTINK
jgi:hypothetical protein